MGMFENVFRNVSGMEPAPELKQKIIERAKGSERAELKEDGSCSHCGQKVRAGNFCEKCNATFLTDEMIAKGEIY